MDNMNEQSFALKYLAQIVYDYCGLNFRENLSSLQSKISNRLMELDLSVWRYSKYLEEVANEWDVLIELLTINETYFFREEQQLLEYRKIISSLNRPIKVWSAACSTGEEPYTLAMLATDLGANVDIIATDINTHVLDHAKKAQYKKKSLSFRRTTELDLNDYFDETNDFYCVKELIKNKVSFGKLNLLNDQDVRSIGMVDIIFCRNVLIYFDKYKIEQTIHALYNQLRPDGYLFLGHSESIRDIAVNLKTIQTPSTFYYQKARREGE